MKLSRAEREGIKERPTKSDIRKLTPGAVDCNWDRYSSTLDMINLS